MSSGEITTLDGLLAWLFDEDELRRFIRSLPGGKQLHTSLPSQGTTRASLAFEACDLLDRHGLNGTDLFARLKNERPKRCEDIDRVQALILEHAPAEQDGETNRLAEQLQQAIKRKERLSTAGVSTEAIIEEILSLKRQLRAGGQLREGDLLSDRYLLVRKIGRGGFATVWEAIDQAQNDRVAVKVLHSELAGDIVRRQRFFRGTRIMADLDHLAVVRIREPHAEDGGFCYFVMDYLAGGDLHKAVLAGRVDRDDAVPIILRIGEALTMAHQRGVVHRDVKPANILLSDTGEPFLTDFDLAAAMDTTGGTRTGALGTFLYAAPEMLDRPQDADARVDVYGLGMTAAFVIHGNDLPRSVMGAAATFIRGIDCSPAVAAVFRQATACDLNARYSDAGAFCDALAVAAEVERLLRRYREGQRDFQESDLRGVDLRGADLTNADLRGANLTGVDLRGVDLTGADLTGANLKSALYDVRTRWPEQFLVIVPEVGGYLVAPRKAPFAADIVLIAGLTDLPGVDLRGVDLAHADLYGVDLTGANLAHADLSHADLSRAKLRETDLHGADLTNANLTSADFSNANLSMADLTNAHVSSAKFSNANLSMANFGGANLRGADFYNDDAHGNPHGIVSLRGVKYDRNTAWPRLFDPIAHGAVKVGSDAE